MFVKFNDAANKTVDTVSLLSFPVAGGTITGNSMFSSTNVILHKDVTT